MPRRIFGIFLLALYAGLLFFTTAAAGDSRADRKTLKSQFRYSQPGARLQLQSRTESAAVDTLDILAIRVDFRRDSLTQTTGDGRFILTNSSANIIDAPPHHRAYFEAQLLALKNYYASVSRGKLILRYQVFPAAGDEAYHLDQAMNYYGPGRTNANSDKRLAELLQDGFKKAEATAAIDFSKFDSFILFHAGVGEDFADELDRTPNDIPSAFLTLDDLRKNLGNDDPNYQGIAVRNGTFHIADGIILPETQSRDINGTLVEFGLLGTSTLMFGHQIGLPNLFNTENGAPGIGYFGLMDQGSNNFQGLLPAQPEAWSKIFLGWETPIVVTQGENLDIAAALHENPNKIYKIPINDSEYYLLENRQRDVNGDRIASGSDVNGVRVQFKETGFIAEQSIGVITQVDEYDFGLPYAVDANNRVLPGVGILIWHIDEDVIRKNYKSNRVNADRDHRGVDLEEADGAQDIGRFYTLLDPSAGSENGVAEDAWWKSNPVITQFLRPNKPVEFGPNTMPNTNSNFGAQTGIVITNFSDIQNVMTFSVRNAFQVSSFPQYVSGKANTLPPMLADLTGDGKLDIVVATTAGEILAWQADGRKVIDNLDAANVLQPNGSSISMPKATFAILGDSLFAPPVLVDLNGDRRAEVLTAGKDGKLRAWRASDNNLDGRADLLWQFDLGAACRANIAVRQDSGYIFCGAENGRVVSLFFNGARRWTAPANMRVRGISLFNPNLVAVTFAKEGLLLFTNSGIPFTSGAPNIGKVDFSEAVAIADLDNDGNNEMIYRDATSLNAANLQVPSTQGFSLALNSPEKSGVAIGDINDDGRKEIVLVAKHQLFAYNFNGAVTENFPLSISAVSTAKAQYPITPIIADVDGDATQDVLVAGVDGNVYAYRRDGTLVPGFPLAMSGAGLGSVATADLDGDGKLELVGVSGNGYMHVWRLPSSSKKADWPMYHHDAAQTSLNSVKETPPVIVSDKLLPVKAVYNYPNPTEGNVTTIRYRLSDNAEVKISIYDAAGDLVDELAGAGLGQVDNEVTWNLTNIQSGVYLARVEARGKSETSVAVIKIAVVK